MALTVLNTQLLIQVEDPSIIYRVTPMGALTALAERGSSTWHPPFDEGPVIGTAFDDRVYDARHLGGNGGDVPCA